MNDTQKALVNLIKDNGVKDSILEFISALSVFADEMSDLNLNEKAREASEIVGILQDISSSFEESY